MVPSQHADMAKTDYDSEDDEEIEDDEAETRIAELEKQISELQIINDREVRKTCDLRVELELQRQELDAKRTRRERYRSERDAMRIGVVDALDRVQKKLQASKEMDPNAEYWNQTLNGVFATSLKNAHKGIEILHTYDNNESEHATKVLIRLIKIDDRNYHNIQWIRDILQGGTGNELQNLRNERDELATIAQRYREKYKESQQTVLKMKQQLGEMNAKTEEFLRMSNLPPGPPVD